MSAFWKSDKKEDKSESANSVEVSGNKKNAKTPSKERKMKKNSPKNKELVVPEDKAALINGILKKPMISEAVMIAQEIGKYTFQVSSEATKKEIALAIEALYKVGVIKVNIVNYKAQKKLFRGRKGNRKGYKKAIITLKKGDKIKLFN